MEMIRNKRINFIFNDQIVWK